MSVTPEILKQVKAIELRTRGLVGTLFAGEYRSVFRGQGMEFAEVRAYEVGDDFRSIDWNVSARLASPFVKTFTEERELTLMLLVDQSGSTRFGDPVTKAGLAVEVAAVLALAAAFHNDRVGALLFADQVERVIPPRKGRRHALRVIRDLVAFEPAGRRTNLAASLSYASRLLRHHSIVVVLSDFIAEGWERPLRRLAARHEVVAITVDDPREHVLPDAGWIEMLDAESGRRALVDTGSRDVRAKVSALAAARREERSRTLTSVGARRSRARDRPGLRPAAPARLRPQGTTDPPRMSLQTPQAAIPTVGDTIWVTRTVQLPPGRSVRAAEWEVADPVELLGPARVILHDTSAEVAYPLAVWRPGSHTLQMPGPLLLAPGGGVDSLAPEPVTLRVQSVLPRAAADTAIQPQPRADFVPRPATTPVPLILLLVLAVAVLAPLHWWWRRRGRPRPGPPPTPVPPDRRWTAGPTRESLAPSRERRPAGCARRSWSASPPRCPRSPPARSSPTSPPSDPSGRSASWVISSARSTPHGSATARRPTRWTSPGEPRHSSLGWWRWRHELRPPDPSPAAAGDPVLGLAPPPPGCPRGPVQ